MTKAYTDRYKDDLSELFSEIFRIDSKFCVSKRNAKSDYENGLITLETLKMVEGANYDTILNGEAGLYSLTEDEKKFVKKIINCLDGNLYLNDVNDAYNILLSRMNIVADAVKLYFKFYNKSLKELRISVSVMVQSEYSKKKDKLITKMGTLKKKLGEEYFNDEEYKSLYSKLNEYKKQEKEILADVENSSCDILMEFVCKFYSIDEKFFKWFRVRNNKEKCNNGILPEDSAHTMLEHEDAIRRYEKEAESYSSIENKIKDIQTIINSFSVEISNIENSNGKKFLIPYYTKKQCFLMFVKFCKIPIFLDYCSSFLEENVVTDNYSIFNKFYEKKFGDAKVVKSSKFKDKLVGDVLSYYQRQLIFYSGLLKAKKVTLDGCSFKVNETSDRLSIIVRNNKDFMSDINDDTDYIAGFLANDMLDILYVSLNEYFDYERNNIKSDYSYKKIGKSF